MGDGLLSTKKNAHEVWSIPNQDKRMRTSKVVQETLVADLKMKSHNKEARKAATRLYSREIRRFLSIHNLTF